MLLPLPSVWRLTPPAARACRGTGWGEAGFARMQMTGDGPGACNMYSWAFQPTAA